MTRKLSLKLNGQEIVTIYEEGTDALDLLKNADDRNAIKEPCSPKGSCGNCSILVGGQPVLSCLCKAEQLEGKEVETLGDQTLACLIRFNGRELGKRYVLKNETVTMGRGLDQDIILSTKNASRNHANIFKNSNDEYLIEDNKSTNGTYINFRKITESTKLKNGDMIRIGPNLFKFYDNNNIESAIFDRMYRLATFDELTQVYNRKYLMEALKEELEITIKRNAQLAVIFIDLDYFKKINDTLGHQAGDQVLIKTAQIIKSQVRDFDKVGRYGGEEFVIILPGADKKNAYKIAERMRKAIDTHKFSLKLSNEGVAAVPFIHHQTISMGVSWVNENTQSIKKLVNLADKSLYQSKAYGRNRITTMDEIKDSKKLKIV